MAPRKRSLFGNLGGTVLEIGPGTGVNLGYYPPNTRWIGVEPNPSMHAYLRREVERLGLPADLRTGAAEGLEVEDASVDVVTSNGVLNLVPDKARVFREIYRILKPDGRIQISDIVVQSDVQKVCGLVPQLWADCIGGAAVESEYLKTIKEAGFRDVHIINRLDYFSASSSENTKRLTKAFAADSVVITGRKPE